MELIQGLIQPPKVQSVDETIPTLSDRAESATLIGDRRSAVLGLKAFSRDYREAVIASGLKPLLNTLKRDFEDESTLKAILETLLILFIRGDGNTDLTRSWISQQSRLQNGKYPSPLLMKQEMQQVDQFSLWIADAITQSDEIVHLILELLETENFHIRLYAIQLLEAVVATRPLRSRNAINSLPTGISTLVSLLDDAHDVVRDEAVLLLMAVVNDSPHVQKLVAFENIFDRLFSIIDEEGGLRGSLVVSDCLSLINNILKFNTSNQSLFLETGNLPRLARILDEPLSEEDFLWNDQRIINIKTAMDIVSLTVEPGSTATRNNQTRLLEANILMIVLRLAFYDGTPKRVRPIALLTAACIISGNEVSQREFGKIDVPFFDPASPTSSSAEEATLVPVVRLLVHWVLFTNSVQVFQIRVASLELIKAYLYDNLAIQEKFLSQQIGAYGEVSNGQEKDDHLNANLLEAILDYDPDLKLNPFKVFFAADLFMFLFQTDNKASDKMRELMLHVKTGTEVDGVEALSSVQALSELLLASLSSEDIRIPISYVTLLIFWLYGDQKAVDQFLSQRSIVQSLSSFCYQLQDDDATIKCLVTMLLGVSYEFSSQASSFARKDYYEYLTKTLGQDNYLSRINQFKEKSLLNEEQSTGTVLTAAIDETGLPQVYFSPIFIHFFAANSYRIKTALLHKPEEEPLLKLSFELFEELQNECSAVKKRISSLEEASRAKIDQLTIEYNELEKAYDLCKEQRTAADEKYSFLTQKSDRMEKDLAEAVSTINYLKEQESRLTNWKEEKIKEIKDKESKLNELKEKSSLLEKDLKNIRTEKEKAENGINKMNRELLKLTKENEKLQKTIDELDKAKNKASKDLEGKQRDLEDMKRQYQILQEQNQKSLVEINEWEGKYRAHDQLVSKLTEKLRSVAESFQETQKERDDLLITVESLQAKHDQSLAKCNEELSALSSKHSDLIHSQEQNVLQLEQLRRKVKELEDEKKSNSLSLADRESNITKLNQELQSLTNQKQLLEKTNDELKESIAENESSNKETNGVLARLQKDLQLSEEKVTILESKKQAAENLVQTHQHELEEALKSLKALQDECKYKAETVTSLENEIKNKQTTHALDIEKYKSELETLRKEGAKISSLVSDLKKTVAGAKQEYAKLEHELQRTKQDQKNQQEKSCKEIAQLNTIIENLKKEAEELRAKLKQTKEQKDILDKDLRATKEHESSLVTEVVSIKAIMEEKNAALEELEKAQSDALAGMQQPKQNAKRMTKKSGSEVQDQQAALQKTTEGVETKGNICEEGSNSVTEKYSQEISALESKIDKVEREYENAKTQLELYQSNFAQLKSESEKSLKERQDKIQTLGHENANLREKAEKTDQECRKLKEATGKERAELKAKLHALERTIDERTEDNKVLQDDLEKMKGEITKGLDSKVEALKKDRFTLEQKVKKLTADNLEKVQSLQSQLDTLSKDNNGMKAELDGFLNLLTENATIENGNIDLKERLKRLKDKVAAGEQISVKHKNVIAEHENQINSLTDRNASLSAELTSKESELSQLKLLLETKSKEADDLQETKLSEMQELREQLVALKNQNEELLNKSKNNNEIDDLMLLVTDLDERNARYRELLKNNGIDLPSDIDEDEDEDEEEEEDEEGGEDSSDSQGGDDK
ncbi:hypothetical protein HG536_0E01580 [Torulaspora globosa]|uniref:Intracellular protein transport protein USO1 n=1 Tax=Torulaspora globosa TaxID=48254 RepID=A0A7G3ZIB1_9SACH|nr:uncharacterized protein HG536_0E01580 [Torulaspora globosa]QLL33247.1 hypothetical protein HG536_0E01580 [Torulaspora globosa]